MIKLATLIKERTSEPTNVLVFEPATSAGKISRLSHDVESVGGKIIRVDTSNKNRTAIYISIDRDQYSDIVAEWDTEEDLLFYQYREWIRFIRK